MRIFKLFAFFVCLFFFTTAGASSQKVWGAADIPIPYLQDARFHVSDPDRLLGQQALDSTNFYLGKLERDCRVQNVLVLVDRVKDGDAFRMAQDVGNKYGVGDKKNRRGLVVVIAVSDRKYFIAPGSGLEGELTDVDCDDIARACIVANMKRGAVDSAVVDVSRAIYNKVKTGYTGIPEVDDDTMGDDELFAVVVIFALCFGLPIYYLVRYVLEEMGVIKKRKKSVNRRFRNNHDDFFPPFFFGGGGGGFSSGGGSVGGSFGGGTFSGGGSGGSW